MIGRRDGHDFQNLHRNKRVMTLDLKSPEGYGAFLELVKVADILVENMRVKVKHRLKIAYEDLQSVNSRLVYGSISGFGQTGPYAERPGVDQIIQGMSGMMSITGEPGTAPMRSGIAVSDLTSGNHLAFAIMVALYDREKTGVGTWVSTSLLEGAVFMTDFQATRFLVNKEVPKQVGNFHPTGVPTGVFETSDGHVSIGASSSEQWKKLCGAIERSEWTERPQWKTMQGRAKDRPAVLAAVGSEIKKKSTQIWVDLLNTLGVPCGPIYSIDQVFDDPQVKHLGIATPINHPKFGLTHLIASPINILGKVKRIRSAVPSTGIHTEEILEALRYVSSQGSENKNSMGS